MKRMIRILLGTALLGAVCQPANATPITFSGYLNDAGNAALVASDLSGPLFVDEYDIANNVALYTLNVTTAGTATFTSLGYAQGGVDPYFTLFEGGASTATFFASNYNEAYSTGGDFTISVPVAVGTYQMAVGAFANLSFAENYGTGTLADGFIALGVPYSLGDPNSTSYSYYELQVTLPTETTPVPEPASVTLTALGLAAAAARRRRSKGRDV